jgi:L-ribulose-5-phosphate 3-epimerase
MPIKYGIVQGRLIQSPEGCLQWFPQNHWETEFFLASAIGLDYIELIAEREHNNFNPIWTDDGINKIKELTLQNHIHMHSLCNDYIINHSLIGRTDAFEQNIRLISRAKRLGVQKLILPLFEESELNKNNFEDYISPLKNIANVCYENDIFICLETILNGKDLCDFIDSLNHPQISCVFDTGNRIAFGHDIYSDILLLGNRIQHVHIKDKNENNENVFLGTGKVDFQKVFQSLHAIRYNGPYTFETCRGKDPLKTARFNTLFTDFFIKGASEDESQ